VSRPTRAAFIYSNPRSRILAEIAAGRAPDTSLLGQNHLPALGVETTILEPFLQRHRPPALLARLAWNARELSAPFEIRRADVLCTALGPLVGVVGRLRPGLRTVLFTMSLANRLQRADGLRRRVLAAGVRSADAIVCFADAQRNRVLALSGADSARVHTLPLGVDDRFHAPAGPPPADGYVLAVGRDLARDYRTLAAAVDGVAAPVVLVCSARNLVDLQLPANVRAEVDITPLELRELYRGACCIVIPTRAEQYPYGADCSGQTVLLDAWANARPVIVTQRSTLRGYADEDENALVVPPEEPEALRSAVVRMLADHELAQRLGAAGRALVERELTTRRFAERLAGLLTTLHA
jgi:glycosyltransferase involved in cell wall biosynthesis